MDPVVPAAGAVPVAGRPAQADNGISFRFWGGVLASVVAALLLTAGGLSCVGGAWHPHSAGLWMPSVRRWGLASSSGMSVGAHYPVQGSSPVRPLVTAVNLEEGGSVETATFWSLWTQHWGDFLMRGILTTFCLAMASASWFFRAKPLLRASNQ